MKFLNTIVKAEARPKAHGGLNTRSYRAFLSAVLAIMLVVSLGTVAFAASGTGADLFDNIKSASDDLTSNIRNVLTSVGGLFLIVAALFWGFGSQRTSESGKAWCIRILVCLAVIWCADIIINTVKSIVGATGP